MWITVCKTCAWTSGTLLAHDNATTYGKFHAQDYSGHTVKTIQVPASLAARAVGTNGTAVKQPIGNWF